MRLALFGGTFDPIHKAHLLVGREAADQLHLDRVLFVPAANPPHKQGTGTCYAHRMRMTELACQADPRFEASRLEEGTARSYSFDTLTRVKAQLRPKDEMFFLIGADAFAEIGTWHRSADVIGMVDFVVVTRPGHDYQTPEGARVHRLVTLALPVSSSEIRQQLQTTGYSPELPAAVMRYIRAHGLYSQPIQ